MKYSELKPGTFFCFTDDPDHPKLKVLGGRVNIENGLSYTEFFIGDDDVEILDFADVTALRAELAEAYAGIDAIHDVAMQYQERMKHGDELERAASVARDRRKVEG